MWSPPSGAPLQDPPPKLREPRQALGGICNKPGGKASWKHPLTNLPFSSPHRPGGPAYLSYSLPPAPLPSLSWHPCIPHPSRPCHRLQLSLTPGPSVTLSTPQGSPSPPFLWPFPQTSHEEAEGTEASDHPWAPDPPPLVQLHPPIHCGQPLRLRAVDPPVAQRTDWGCR